MRVVPGERHLDEVVAEEARSSRDQETLARHAPQVGVEVLDHGGEVAVAYLAALRSGWTLVSGESTSTGPFICLVAWPTSAPGRRISIPAWTLS